MSQARSRPFADDAHDDRRRPPLPPMSGRRQPYFDHGNDYDDAALPCNAAQTPRSYICGESTPSGGSPCDGIHDMEFGGGPPPGPGLMKEPRGHHGPHHHQGPPLYGSSAPLHHMHGHHHGQLSHNQSPVPQGHGCVLMVYGLDPRTANADRLFNLVCLYGNVIRVKFLKTKEGTAMVQMGDALSVERCVQNLNNVSVGENTLTLAFSKQPYLSEVTNPYPLQDKSPSFKEYVGNKNNRFLTQASIHKNRIQPPSKILHFFNTPPDVTEDQLLTVFNDYGVDAPFNISKFPLKSEKSSSGLMEFANTSQAVQAIMACNHATIAHPGVKFPFVMKLCFSSARTISSNNHGSKLQNNNNASAEQNHQDTDDNDDCEYE